MIVYGGTQKAGSGWLYRTLASDPSLTRFRKEWHYWRSVGRVDASRLSELAPLDAPALQQQKFARLLSRDARSRVWGRGGRLSRMIGLAEHESALEQWVTLCRSVDIADFTPSNVLLSEPQWSEIAAAVPEARIIVSVRNPVQRAWSQIRKDRRKRPEASLDEDAVIEAALSPAVRRRSCVAATVRLLLTRWPGQVLVTSLDDISEDPLSVAADLASFAGVGRSLVTPGVVNAGLPAEMPRGARAVLEREWASELADLEDIASRPLRR